SQSHPCFAVIVIVVIVISAFSPIGVEWNGVPLAAVAPGCGVRRGLNIPGHWKWREVAACVTLGTKLILGRPIVPGAVPRGPRKRHCPVASSAAFVRAFLPTSEIFRKMETPTISSGAWMVQCPFGRLPEEGSACPGRSIGRFQKGERVENEG